MGASSEEISTMSSDTKDNCRNRFKYLKNSCVLTGQYWEKSKDIQKLFLALPATDTET